MPGRSSVVLIGLGNDLRHDDGIGLYAAGGVKEKQGDNIVALIGIKDSAALIERLLCGAKKAYIIDCTSSGAAPGTIYRFNTLTDEIPGDIFKGRSTHALDLEGSIRLARALSGRIPDLIIFGIEGKDFSFGRGFSDDVRKAADEVIGIINSEINHRAGGDTGPSNE